MTPSQQAKAAGLKSLLEVSEITSVSTQTLTNWAKNKPKLFRVVLVGARERYKYNFGA
tara:strand:- start:3266 stop:3439 length:174 start_codon:yes stop_codon:yes gene_type:complete